MYYLVTNSTKKLFVQIFQDIVSKHPIFEKTQVYTKFPQTERPKIAIIIRSVSGDSLKLDFNNFVGIHRGYCSLANLKGIQGNSIEWVKDDQENLDKLSARGFYIVRITEHQQDSNNFKFEIDPYLVVDDEELEIKFIKEKHGAVLKNLPINPNTEIVYSESYRFEFKRDIDYSIDYSTGEILFTENVGKFEPIVVDYQIMGSRMGPFDTEYYSTHNTAIPGVVLAFGDRLRVGDEQVVIVEKENRDVAKVFGGRWILNFQVIGMCQDPDQQERLVDYVVTVLWSEYQDELANQGIVIRDFSFAGESEELEVEVPEEYNFSGAIGFTVETDWEVYVPMITEVRRINYNYGEESFKQKLDYLSEERYEVGQYDDRMMGSDHQKGLQIIPSRDSYQVSPSVYQKKTRKFD